MKFSEGSYLMMSSGSMKMLCQVSPQDNVPLSSCGIPYRGKNKPKMKLLWNTTDHESDSSNAVNLNTACDIHLRNETHKSLEERVKEEKERKHARQF
jgi:hypothetical protein